MKSLDADLPGRYLADQLSATERRLFEQRMIEDPRVVRDLEAAATMKLGLLQLEQTGRLSAVAGGEFANGTRWLLAAAASMVLGVAVLHASHEGEIAMMGDAGVFRWNAPVMAASPSSLLDDQGIPLGVAVSYPLYRARSMLPDATIVLPRMRQAIELRILPEATADGEFTVALRNLGTPGNQGRMHLKRLRAAADGFVSVFVDSGYFAGSDYEVTISGTKDQYPIETTAFTLRVVNAP